VNVMGEEVRLVDATDPGKKGIAGRVVLETANTLLIDSGSKSLIVEKSGSVFLIISSGTVVTGADIAGRLEDRWGGRSR
jgi:RNase P/RNase MRP subunit p29